MLSPYKPLQWNMLGCRGSKCPRSASHRHMWMWKIHVYTPNPQLEVFPVAKQSFQSEPPLLLRRGGFSIPFTLTKLRHSHPNQLCIRCGVVFVLPFWCNRVYCKASSASAVR